MLIRPSHIAIFILLFTITVPSQKLFSQNLVPDGSFEQDTACPQATYVYNNLYWKNPTAASPDYYDTCSTSYLSSVPNNYMGNQNACAGGAYVGLITKASGDYQEYVQVALTNSLTAGRAYCVKFYVSLAGRSAYATKGPQAYFSNSAISSNSQTYLQYTPQIINPSIITDTTNWVLISGTYNAIGGESYITLGNFYSDSCGLYFIKLHTPNKRKAFCVSLFE